MEKYGKIIVMIQKMQEKIYAISKKWGEKLGLDLPYFVKNGFWVAIRQVVGAISGLALSVAFARLATQEVFGQYQFVLSVLSIVSIISIPGLNTSLIRSVAKGFDGDYRNVVRTSFLWSLLGVPALLVVGGYYYLYQNQTLGIAFMISSIFFPFFYAPNTWDSFLQGKSRFDVSAKYSSIQAIINTLATMAVIFFYRNNLVAIVITYLISYSFFNGYYFWKSLKYVQNERKDEETIKYGWFLTKISVLNMLSSNADRFALGILAGPEQLAIYSVVSVIALKTKDLFKAVSSIFLPKFSKLKGVENQKKVFLKKENYLGYVFSIVAIFIISMTYYIFIVSLDRFIFPESYHQYLYLAKYFTVTIFLCVPIFVIGRYITALGDRVSIIMTNPFLNIITIFFDVYFIAKYGLVGIVISYNLLICIGFIVHVSYFIYLLRKSDQKHQINF